MLRDAVHDISRQFLKLKSQVVRADGNPKYVNSSIAIKVKYNIPPRSDHYPQLGSIYKTICHDLSTLSSEYKSIGTQLITCGMKAHLQQLRCERVDVLLHYLIFKIGQYHISYYRKIHARRAIQDPSKPTTTNSQVNLAIIAVYQVLVKLDLEMLEFLDFNQEKLLEFYKSKFPDMGTANTLSEMDLLAVKYTIDLILTCIKPTICLNFKEIPEEEKQLNVEARLCAEMEANEAEEAMAATNAAIQHDAQHLPRDAISLHNALALYERQQARIAQKKQKRKEENKAKQPPQKKHKTSQVNQQAGREQAQNQHQPTPQATNPGSNSPTSFVISARQLQPQGGRRRTNNNNRNTNKQRGKQRSHKRS